MRFVTDEDSKKNTKILRRTWKMQFSTIIRMGRNKKPNWIPEVILAEDEQNNIIGSLCILIRKMPIFGNPMYASKRTSMWCTRYISNKAINRWSKRISKKYNAIGLRIEPDVESDDQTFRNIVENLGYHIKDDAKDFKDQIQPRYVFSLDY